MKSKNWLTQIVCLGSVVFAGLVNATITPLQSLNFGTIVVTKNTFASTITIDPAGNVQVVGGIVIISPGNHAVYELSDLPANRNISVDVASLNSNMIPSVASEETFNFSLVTSGNPVITDNNGVALLSVGGKITTSGSGGIRFTDADYTAVIQITINL